MGRRSSSRPVQVRSARTFAARLAAGRASEQAAVGFLEALRGWDRKPQCVRCGDRNVYQMRSRSGHRNARFLWRCRSCNSQYTVRADTLFEDSRVGLRHWCAILHAACNSRDGIATLEISRRTGVSNVTALYMIDRIGMALGSRARVDDGEGADGSPGRAADRLKLHGKWMSAVRRALNSSRSEHG